MRKLDAMKFATVDTTHVPIYAAVTDDEVARALSTDRARKAIGSAHWFREAGLWYRLSPGYNNPLNIGSVHSELFLIKGATADLAQHLEQRTLVFFGVGVGDTEMALVDMQLESSGYSEQIVVDVNPVFLNAFTVSLRARRIENGNIVLRCAPLRGLFETIEPSLLHPLNARYGNTAIVCLGATIGNYSNTEEILRIFRSVSKSGDSLVLGYQMATHMEVIFRRYESNELFRELIGNFLDQDERLHIRWNVGPGNAIEAWLGDIQLFRSRKFGTDEVASLAQSFGWREVLCRVDAVRNVALHVFAQV